jgi:hypothetical protein
MYSSSGFEGPPALPVKSRNVTRGNTQLTGALCVRTFLLKCQPLYSSSVLSTDCIHIVNFGLSISFQGHLLSHLQQCRMLGAFALTLINVICRNCFSSP